MARHVRLLMQLNTRAVRILRNANEEEEEPICSMCACGLSTDNYVVKTSTHACDKIIHCFAERLSVIVIGNICGCYQCYRVYIRKRNDDDTYSNIFNRPVWQAG